jgi:hypothetical protein
MRYRLSVLGAFWVVILGLEYVFDVPAQYDSFLMRFSIAVILAAGLTFFWFQFRPRRPD